VRSCTSSQTRTVADTRFTLSFDELLPPADKDIGFDKSSTMAFYTSADTVNAIVADFGSYASKVGYAGEDYPRSYFRSVRRKTAFAIRGRGKRVQKDLQLKCFGLEYDFGFLR
jgi:hypothetical protein